MAWLAEYEQLEQSCIDEGLLTKAFGKGNLRITKKGQQFVKLAAATDEEVAATLQEAVHTPWLERREALVTLVVFARHRQPPGEAAH
jgi:hypothetical protein